MVTNCFLIVLKTHSKRGNYSHFYCSGFPFKKSCYISLHVFLAIHLTVSQAPLFLMILVTYLLKLFPLFFEVIIQSYHFPIPLNSPTYTFLLSFQTHSPPFQELLIWWYFVCVLTNKACLTIRVQS